MSDTIQLSGCYYPSSRPASVLPKMSELTKRSPPHRLSISAMDRASPAKYPRIELHSPDNNINRRLSAPTIPSPTSTPFDRRASCPVVTPNRAAQQLAAEALLGMAPSTNGQNRSPEKRPAEKPPLVPAPAHPSTSTPASRTTSNAMDIDTPEGDSRGVKRKVVEDDPRLPSAVTLGLHGIDRERERAKESRYSHSPLAATEARQPNPPAGNNASRLGQSPASSLLGGSTANRYSVYGPTTRDPLGGSPWGLNSSRYSALGLRRDLSPSVPTVASSAPKPSALDPPQRASPDAGRDSRFYPGSVTGYGHYSMGRRELTEHREQLREGKRWLEAMLAKTEKMLHMVENKMALTGEMGSSITGPPPPGSSSSNPNPNAGPSSITAKLAAANPGPGARPSTDDWEFEERERLRQKEILRLEREREMDRVEREKRGLERERDIQRERERERERDRERERERERDRLERVERLGGNTSSSSILSADSDPLGRGRRDKSEAERNRDLLLASRRITAVSPNPATANASSNANATPNSRSANNNGSASNNATPANSSTNNAANSSIAAGGGHSSSANSTPNTRDHAPSLRERERERDSKTGSQWDGEPVLGGVALPRREQQQQSSISRALGRGLWSFDVRG
ncbi:uncharacterized protein L201_001595 [Kwoniella dendrophila CBS 6074]|uniref:Uncharacterized protein n=1 Tax=Kwoniella dendrophila CBS 6074 TaxID=1295534 RepID=A0AAX4JMW2_9TREE